MTKWCCQDDIHMHSYLSKGGTSFTLKRRVVLQGLAKLCQVKQILKLVACLGLDFMGDATYFIPALGDVPL